MTGDLILPTARHGLLRPRELLESIETITPDFMAV